MTSTKPRQVTIGLLTLIMSALGILLVELSAFTILTIVDISEGKKLSDAFANRWSEVSDKSDKPTNTSIGDYDPLSQVQFQGNFKVDNFLSTNMHGYISNGKTGSDNSLFPRKAKNVVRIILLGGSSTAGTGSEKPEDTISSRLEVLLNEQAQNLHQDLTYQVLNFGHPGAHSSVELSKLTQYLVYLRPDIVIAFDGFNDAWYARFEHKRQGLNFPIINWADFSYSYYNLFQYKIGARPSQGLSWLPFSSKLINSFVYNIQNSAQTKAIETYPPYMWSEYIYTKNQDQLSPLAMNWKIAGSLACRDDFHFIGLLQPHALEDVSHLTESEKSRIKRWAEKIQPYNISLENYTQEMETQYDKYERDLAELERSFAGCSKASFQSMRKSFTSTNDRDRALFVDNIHYTPEGNAKLASLMTEIIITQINGRLINNL
jgi:hypothetical protein